MERCHKELKPTIVMGILNITPDSFSDGGLYFSPEVALKKALAMYQEGAKIVDIGGESTRPGAEPISASEELRRVTQVLNELICHVDPLFISVDSRNCELINKVVDLGVGYINSVAGVLPDVDYKKITNKGTKFIAMHMHGNPKTMQNEPLEKKEAIEEVDRFFSESYSELSKKGLRAENIFLDPGIGFGKTVEANFALLKRIATWSKKFQICVGLSRKSFMAKLWNLPEPSMRDDVSKALEFGAMVSGAAIIRTHEVFRISKLIRMVEQDYA